MKTIIWNDTVSCSDSQAELEALKLLTNDTIYAGNMIVVDYARLMRATEQIESLVIVYNNHEYEVNEYGALHDAPEELWRVTISEQILRAALKRKKASRSGKSC